MEQSSPCSCPQDFVLFLFAWLLLQLSILSPLQCSRTRQKGHSICGVFNASPTKLAKLKSPCVVQATAKSKTKGCQRGLRESLAKVLFSMVWHDLINPSTFEGLHNAKKGNCNNKNKYPAPLCRMLTTKKGLDALKIHGEEDGRSTLTDLTATLWELGKFICERRFVLICHPVHSVSKSEDSTARDCQTTGPIDTARCDA